MRIGLMLRTYDEHGGIGVYSRGLVKALLELDKDNQYFLFYKSAEHLGTHITSPNVTEMLIRAPGKLLWDQIAVPLVCRQKGIDVVLHPKFTVPFLAPCGTVMVVHGADWFIQGQADFYGWFDIRYNRAVMPLYFKRASKVISVSQLTTDNFYRALDLPDDKIRTIYFGPASHFEPVVDPEPLERAKTIYDLPDRFIFSLTKRGGGERKNLAGLLEAYRLYHDRIQDPAKLVIGGKDCHLFRQEFQIPEDGFGSDIHFPGYIDQEHLPAVYSLAKLFLYPSNLEAFPIPLTEAMACGTPIVTSNVNGLEEIAGDAALYVDPTAVDMIAKAVEQILNDPELRRELAEKGQARATQFNWRVCAEKTLAVLNEVHYNQQ